MVAAKAVVGTLIRRLQVRVLPGVHLYIPGDVAEWLGKGLQNPVRRFESARRLTDSFM